MQCSSKLYLAVSWKDGRKKSGPVLLSCSRPAASTVTGQGAKYVECFRGKCSCMERSHPSAASVPLEEARALFGHHTWFEFYLDLFIQSPVLLALTWCFPACFFFLTLPASGVYHINHMATKYNSRGSVEPSGAVRREWRKKSTSLSRR